MGEWAWFSFLLSPVQAKENITSLIYSKENQTLAYLEANDHTENRNQHLFICMSVSKKVGGQN